MPQMIYPQSEAHWLKLRTIDITSTEAAALFGLSPYSTYFELWHRKHSGEVPEFKTNERMTWGTRLQDVIARGIAEDNGWTVRKLTAYVRHNQYENQHNGMGSSFDFEIVNHPDGPGILEIKAVDGMVFRDNWLVNDDGSIEAPEHIELQLQHQLEVINREWGIIAALVGGNQVKILRRKRDREVGAAIMAKIKKFWESIDSNQPPAPEFPADAEMVSSLFGFAEPGRVLDAQNDDEITAMCQEYSNAAKREKDAKEDKETAKAKMLMKVGDAERVLAKGFTVSLSMTAPAMIEAYERKGFRNFRVTAKKAK